MAKYTIDSLGRKHDAKTGRLVASKRKASKGKRKASKGKRKASKGAMTVRAKGHAKGASLASRVSNLEHNQEVIVKAVSHLNTRVNRIEGAVAELGTALGRRFNGGGHKQLGPG